MHKSLLKTFGILSVLAVIAVSGSLFMVQADDFDFSFTVPVRLRDLHPDISKARVWCQVYQGAPGENNDGGDGFAEAELRTLSNIRQLNGTIEVKFNAKNGFDAWRATHYACRLSLLVEGNDNAGNPVSVDAEDQRFRAQAGLVKEITGVLP